MRLILVFLLMSVTMTACQEPDQPALNTANPTDAAQSDPMIGCYTVSHDESAQIKISKSGAAYAMQMRQFNDPAKDWDQPEPMQLLANDSAEISKYFDIQAAESQFLETVIARPDRVFVLAKVTDSFANLNPQYDSPYLGYIYKGSNTVYKVSCSGGMSV